MKHRKAGGMAMLDDFFTRAIIAGIGIALVAGPLGCFVVWRRMAYFGDTLAHSSLLGLALSYILSINSTLSVFLVSALIALSLLYLQRRASLSSDSILGLLSHSALALGLVCIAFLTWVRLDLQGVLFGDILAVSKTDIAVIYAGGAAVLIALIVIWRPLFATTVNRELAEAEGVGPDRINAFFVILLALTIAIAIKVIGVLLITALLIIPAAAARRFATGPEQMAVLAAGIGALSVVGGLFGSLEWDTPSGPSIVVATFIAFLVSLALPSVALRQRLRRL
ncbi:metal ABC transporter permease [Hwanghaeella sp. 1Z406]|uniref:metal ABC transporter permease n=2 Tax=unclassified Hwanghaeella TaxID=2605944 RepID=UPI003B681A58